MHCVVRHGVMRRGVELDLHLTLNPQEVGVEAEKVGAEVEPALTGNPAPPVAAGVVGHQLFFFRKAEPLLKSQQGLSELLWVLLLCQGGLPLFSNETLKMRRGEGRRVTSL